MFYRLPNGQVINKNQIIKIDENSVGDIRLLMTGGVTVVVKSVTIDEIVSSLEEL